VLRPEPGQPRRLRAESLDAGQLFKLVGFYPNAVGGLMTLDVNLDGEGAAERLGTLWARDFLVLGDPIISEVLQSADGQIIETHSISAGLDYPGVGPEHAWLHDIGRAEYVAVGDDDALAAFHRLCRTEGIIPALESSHAVAYAMKLAATMRPDQHLLVNLSGRGDKDIATVAELDAKRAAR